MLTARSVRTAWVLAAAIGLLAPVVAAPSASAANSVIQNPSAVRVGHPSVIKERSAIAKLFVPRFGKNWSRVVYEGVSVSRVLTPLGIGHYPKTALPGQEGNFAMAAHRFASGGAFLKIDKLQKGDLAYVETATMRFTYKFLMSKIVLPSDVWVVDPEPAGLTVPTTSSALMTFTTCTPVHVNTHRYIAWFELISEADL